jgi:hypothetical protein
MPILRDGNTFGKIVWRRGRMQVWVASKNSRFLHHCCPRIIHNVSAGLQIFGKLSLAAKSHWLESVVSGGWNWHVAVIVVVTSIVQEVDLGFTPKHYYTDSLGFSLWNYAAPSDRCLTYAETKQSGIFYSDGGGNVYSNSFISNDTNWSVARIFAVVGAIFGTFSLVCVQNNSISS